MSNHILNILEMKGIASLPLFTTRDEGTDLDFETLVPMPQELLDAESGSMTLPSIMYFLTKQYSIPPCELDKKSRYMIKKLVGRKWLKEIFPYKIAQMRDMSPQERTRIYEAGRNYVLNYEKYGCPTWYEWRWRRWGTPYQAWDTYISNHDTVSFYTAWGPPREFLCKLSRTYPEIKIHHFWEDRTYPGYMEHRWLYAGKVLVKPCPIELEDWYDEEWTEQGFDNIENPDKS